MATRPRETRRDWQVRFGLIRQDGIWKRGSKRCVSLTRCGVVWQLRMRARRRECKDRRAESKDEEDKTSDDDQGERCVLMRIERGGEGVLIEMVMMSKIVSKAPREGNGGNDDDNDSVDDDDDDVREG
ncbi:uncharacterized protein UHOD_12335 [Ustilago sp. UG-2017b]|nr:uncharacterized protein UHOD_12335 [Ustilago sp. UG-2017b]